MFLKLTDWESDDRRVLLRIKSIQYIYDMISHRTIYLREKSDSIRTFKVIETMNEICEALIEGLSIDDKTDSST
jgi:hypothetical protein